MKKKGLKNERGITLIMLMLTIIIIALLLGVVASNIDIGGDIRNYNYMCADIELLEAKIMTYYNENGSIPTTGGAITEAKDILGAQASPRDNDNYYQIDINKLYNITLNYGGGTPDDSDIYIVNEQSHNVYYLRGVIYENNVYHTIVRRDGSTGDDTGDGDDTEEEVYITLTVNVTERKYNRATITATGTINTDDTLNYTLTLSDGQIFGPNTTNTWNITGLTPLTQYNYTVKAETIDKTHSIEKNGSFITPEEENSAPILTAYDYKSGKTTTQFTIAMSATDANGDDVTFTLKASTAQYGTYYTIATVTASSGAIKTIPVTSINGTSLYEYTRYWWKVEVTDGNDGTDETVGSLYTYCSGGYECSGWSCSGHILKCDDCGGSGKAKGHEWVWTHRTDSTNGTYSTSCPNCEVHYINTDWYECPVLGCEAYRFVESCMTCGTELQEVFYKHDTTISCPTCNGNPIEYIACPTHGYSTDHWACDDWSTDDSSAIQHYHQCAHGFDDPHD